jgi:hypothetical protein
MFMIVRRDDRRFGLGAVAGLVIIACAEGLLRNGGGCERLKSIA